MSAVQEIPVAEVLQADLRQGIIVDVRSEGEFAQKRLLIPVALAPVGTLDPHDFALKHGILSDTPIYTLCASGMRAKMAAEKFKNAGFKRVFAITGGIFQMQEAGAPVYEAPPKQDNVPMTMERQVRILMGVLTVLFSLLAIIANPVFMLAALVMGAGQVYSGITDWCGIALLLSKAPWNASGACAVPKAKATGASCQ